ncbi:uncharacterized protein B0I36DRAFT_27617 [Microdochium trichocladiopsis]|uniref:Uncharacterized protein n=1 Tax=Microdochium trichocladiopsis TaxID=1682393 RepID=A0A9P9BK96_9PEZI|nr:uncharacterized protein B0I36DRAFT_27617 [Microdochium trichocladiopsis]KAH7020984.1 hypothetical protein B0I36DRAFT_27617 [Microdochium trichocladiopsis]
MSFLMLRDRISKYCCLQLSRVSNSVQYSHKEPFGTHVRSQLLLLGLVVRLLGSLGGRGSRLVGLLRIALALLLPLLELRLGDLLSSHLVEVQVGDLLGRGRFRVGHVWGSIASAYDVLRAIELLASRTKVRGTFIKSMSWIFATMAGHYFLSLSHAHSLSRGSRQSADAG